MLLAGRVPQANGVPDIRDDLVLMNDLCMWGRQELWVPLLPLFQPNVLAALYIGHPVGGTAAGVLPCALKQVSLTSAWSPWTTLCEMHQLLSLEVKIYNTRLRVEQYWPHTSKSPIVLNGARTRLAMSLVLGVDTQPSIYLGVWTNWSRGKVLGSTLTMTQRNGALLVAFVALFVTFVGARLWRITCFAIHNAYSDTGPQDAVYHHRLAVLRNSDNATAGLVSWYQLLRAWRKVGGRPFRRLLPIALLTALMAVSLTAASLLSSRIASAMGQEVLVRGSCGVNILGHYIAGQDKNPEVETCPAFFTVLLPFLAQRLISFSNYALGCYSNSIETHGCNTFVKDRLHFTSNRSASCPFPGDVCRLTDGNLFLDTGYLNSHFDFGMNARPEERFLYRRTTHCAPLVIEGYKSFVNFSDSGINQPYTQYSYGPAVAMRGARSNATYSYPISQRSPGDRWSENRSRTNMPDYTLGFVVKRAFLKCACTD
jgi:hypothetical protein